MAAGQLDARGPAVLRLRAHPLRVALVGNPNVGKSAIFGRLTGRYAAVSNYPGTTVAMTTGRTLLGAEVCDIIDTPGVNALEGHLSEDERITRKMLVDGGAELVVQVADARNLRRALNAIGIVLPVVTTFFLVFGFLEDSGYIPRLAIFCDRLFRADRAGLIEMSCG